MLAQHSPLSSSKPTGKASEKAFDPSQKVIGEDGFAYKDAYHFVAGIPDEEDPCNQAFKRIKGTDESRRLFRKGWDNAREYAAGSYGQSDSFDAESSGFFARKSAEAYKKDSAVFAEEFYRLVKHAV